MPYLAVFGFLLLGMGGCQGQLAPVEAPAAGPRDEALVERGRNLAAIGNCASCHTRHGGEPYAGGEPMASPFGTIYSTNITPDPETGIGRWSFAAFHRAMRQGIRADGAHLYPAFPYDRFTRVSEEDNRAIYAYLMSLPPVRHVPPSNELRFPFNIRAGIALWKALHFREGPRPIDASRGAALARGEYLVEGLGHCGSCHSPRTALYGEDLERAYDGGELGGWHAYAINSKFAGPVPWDVASLSSYLRHGYHPQHGVARGTMGPVTHDLAAAAPADIEAIASHVISLMGPVAPARARQAREVLQQPLAGRTTSTSPEGARIYETACLGCHDGRRELPFGGIPLALSLGLHGESPRNLINVILHGLSPAEGQSTPMMPGYAGALSDGQVESLVLWLRATFTDKPAWTDVAQHIRRSRQMPAFALLHPPGGAGAEATPVPAVPQVPTVKLVSETN